MASHPSCTPLPIIDSHIHLYAAAHLPRLNWTADLPDHHTVNRQNSIDEYRAATKTHSKSLQGFIFVETDRKSGLESTEWEDALDEISFLVRIARGTPREGEGHGPEDGRLVLGIVPWAPVPTGQEGLDRYLSRVQQRTGDDKWHLIKGFRYLVQDKASGVMLEPKFIDGLQWLGAHDLAFDLGVDAHSMGIHQLEEACEMMTRLYSQRESTLKIVINHFCKPNLQLTAKEALEGHSDFTRWRDCIQRMASHRHTYMKLSGFFSELLEQEEDGPTDISVLVERTKPWVDVVFEVFGASRTLFGSDWPVSNIGGPGITKSWDHWHDLVEAIFVSQNLTSEEKARIWSGTAIEAYIIELPS